MEESESHDGRIDAAGHARARSAEGAWRLAAELVASASSSRRCVGDVREAVSV